MSSDYLVVDFARNLTGHDTEVPMTPEKVSQYLPCAAPFIDWQQRTFAFPVQPIDSMCEAWEPAEILSTHTKWGAASVSALLHALLRADFQGNAYYFETPWGTRRVTVHPANQRPPSVSFQDGRTILLGKPVDIGDTYLDDHFWPPDLPAFANLPAGTQGTLDICTPFGDARSRFEVSWMHGFPTIRYFALPP